MKDAKEVLNSSNQELLKIPKYNYARKRKLASMENRVKDAKMLLALSSAAGIGFGGLTSWLLYPQISAEATVQGANLMAVGAGGAVAFMFMAVPTIVYTIERKKFKEFKKAYDEFEKNQ